MIYIYIYIYILLGWCQPLIDRTQVFWNIYLIQETVNKTTKIMANIDHCHSNKMRHMWLPQSSIFRCAASQLYILHFPNLIANTIDDLTWVDLLIIFIFNYWIRPLIAYKNEKLLLEWIRQLGNLHQIVTINSRRDIEFVLAKTMIFVSINTHEMLLLVIKW